ncbi:MAG: hypothetical protein JWM78_3837, partial [Verrucomicrobiaceae bacterium]|nr:hypothetical protein [Verrucomicrobiaceae bacterium]
SLADGAVIYDINSDYVIVRRGEQMEKLPLHAGDPVVYTATRHSTAKDTVVETTPQLQPATSSTPVTAQTVYKGLEDRLAMIRQNKSS